MATDNPYVSRSFAQDSVAGDAESDSPGTVRRVVRYLLAIFGLVILLSLFLPALRIPGPLMWQLQCRGSLTQIGLAFHNYHDRYGSFPPAHTVDAEGRPLHSWRTLILPFIGQQQLYDAIDLSKPWDDPANLAFAAETPYTLRCQSADVPAGCTTYLGVAVTGGCFGSPDGTKISDIRDGTSETLMVIEVAGAQAVPWMSPFDEDGRFLFRMNADEDDVHDGMSHGVMADGSIGHLHFTASPQQWQAIVSINGGESVSWDELNGLQ